jgi:hypothetical protein
MGPVLVEGSIRVGFAILIGASLSFLGLGTQPPNPPTALTPAPPIGPPPQCGPG